MEQWKAIEGYEYEVSDHGRIRKGEKVGSFKKLKI